MATTIPLDARVRDRLKAYGTAGMTYSEIITRVLDEVDRQAFVGEMRRLADQTQHWVDLDDA